MIYKTVNFTTFAKSFKEAGRKDQFSYSGLRMLYDWLEDIYHGEDLELDVIGLCCQYAELDKINFLAAYDIEGIDTVEDLEKALIDGDLECVIAYNLDNDIILVNSDY